MNLDNDYYNRDVIVVNNNDDPAVFALNEVMQGTTRVFIQMITNPGTEISRRLYFWMLVISAS